LLPARRRKVTAASDDGEDDAEIVALACAPKSTRCAASAPSSDSAAKSTPTIAKEAIEKKWSEDMIALKIEAAELRASMPQAMQIRTSRAKDAPSDGLVLEAACAITGKLPEPEKKFPEKA
jgi:hypothetical protein